MLSRKRLLALLAIVSITFPLRAQLQSDYIPMQSRGTIPVEFVTSIKGRYQNAIKKIDQKDKAKVKRDKKEFLLESNNQIDMVLKSGKVVFQDEVSDYLGKVADKLLVNNHSLRDQLKFYPIKYENSNAYAYNEGFVFVQIGLIARCQNEAELAFILGHETAHYLKKHSINRHAEAKKAERNEGTYKHSSNDDKLKSIREYSRENETEADEIGFDFMRKAGYNAYAAASSLNGLRYSINPIYSTPFKHTVLEVGYYRIPAVYLIENEPKQKENNSTVEEDEKAKEEEENDDVLSTHPALDTRIENILSDLRVSDTIGKPNYLVSKASFEYVRELCRFELCRIYLINDKLDMAFYHINSLLQIYPNNAFLKRMMAATLYRIAAAANHGNLSKKITQPSKSFDELKASNYLLRKLQKEELNLLAIRYAWYVHNTTPKSADLEQVIDLSIAEYTSAFARNPDDFADSSEFNKSVIESYYLQDTSSTNLITDKKGKIKKGKIKKQAYWFDRSLSRFALSDLKQNDEFTKRYLTIAEANPKRKLRNSSETKEDEEKNSEREDKTIKGGKQKLALSDVKNLILIEPKYILNDERKRISVDHIANEESETALRDMLQTCANQADFNLVLMAANNIHQQDSTLFNEYSVLKEWVSEYFDHSESDAMATDFTRIKEISEKYDSRYAALFVNVSTIQKVPGSTIAIATLVSVVYPILLPWLVTKFFPEKECSFVLIVLDMQENKMIHGNIIHFDTKDRKDLLKSQIYGTLVTLKGKTKK